MSAGNRNPDGYVFILPALILYVLFMFIPMIKTVLISFQDWGGSGTVKVWVGIDNYIRLFTDIIFWKAFLHNVIWVIFTVVVPLIIGLILANILNGKVKAKIIFRVTYFLPYILSLVVVGIVWSWIYNPIFGNLNSFLTSIGLESLACGWLGNENTALLSLLVVGSWTAFGLCMVIILAGMQSIDPVVYEYCTLEGGNSFQKFFYITLPMLKNTLASLILFLTIGSMRVFDLVYIMTKGGPYHTTETMATYLFTKAFRNNEVGYGASVAVFLTLFVLMISFFYTRYINKKDA